MSLSVRGAHPWLLPIPKPAILPKPPLIAPRPPKPKPKEASPPKTQCKRSGCSPAGNPSPPHDDPHPAPAPPDPAPAEGNTIPPHVDRPKTGEDIHNNLRGAISRNEPEVIRPPYTENFQRDIDRANGPLLQSPIGNPDVQKMWTLQGFQFRDEKWKPAVMDKKDHNFLYVSPPPRKGSPTQPDPDDSPQSSDGYEDDDDSGMYRYGEPSVENYHDVEHGSIMVKNQIKLEDDDGRVPFSEKTYQMAREDFGDEIQNLNRIGINKIVNEGWKEKAAIHLKGTDSYKWKTFERGTPEFNDFLGTENAKWAGYMLTDHHGPMNNKDIVSISVAREKAPDGDDIGFMSINLGAPQ